MTLIMVLVLVGFFMAGYWVHKKQVQELEKECKVYMSRYKDELSYYEDAKIVINKKQKELDELSETLQLNFNNRWKEVQTRINENDLLKNQIFVMQKNCSCGGARHESSK